MQWQAQQLSLRGSYSSNKKHVWTVQSPRAFWHDIFYLTFTLWSFSFVIYITCVILKWQIFIFATKNCFLLVFQARNFSMHMYSNFSMYFVTSSPRGCLKLKLLGPTPRVSDSPGLGAAGDSALVASSPGGCCCWVRTTLREPLLSAACSKWRSNNIGTLHGSVKIHKLFIHSKILSQAWCKLLWTQGCPW